jgi:hypothetical protein
MRFKKCGCPSNKEQDATISKSMLKYGFYVHFIHDHIPQDYHTHGLVESFNHLDVQIVLSIPNDIAMYILHSFVALLKKGDRFRDGDIVKGILANDYDIKLWQTVETGRPVLRMLLPDKSGRFPDDSDCSLRFKNQFEVDKF